MTEHPTAPPSSRVALPIAVAMFGCGGLAAIEVWLTTFLPYRLAPLLVPLGIGAGILIGWRLAGGKRASRPTASDDDRGSEALDGAASELGALEIDPMGNAEINGGIDAAAAAHAPNPGVERAIAELRSYPTFTDILNRQMLSVTELQRDDRRIHPDESDRRRRPDHRHAEFLERIGIERAGRKSSRDDRIADARMSRSARSIC